MSFWSEIAAGVRKIVLMESRIDQLTADVERISDHSADHEKRLVRIETLIEIAQAGTSFTPPQIGNDPRNH